ncbi:MAG: ATP-binding protein [Kofleriaceae bacterium]
MRSWLRIKLVGAFLALFIGIGGATLYYIEKTLAQDLLVALDARLQAQAHVVAYWLAASDKPQAVAEQLAPITGTGIVIEDGGKQVAHVGPDADNAYVVTVEADHGKTVTLRMPHEELDNVRARMRQRLFAGFGFAVLLAIVLAIIFVRAITRPIQALTKTAQRMAKGELSLQPPASAVAAGGEIGVLANVMVTMAGSLDAKIGELQRERDFLEVVFRNLVEGVVVVDRDGTIALANDAARPLVGETLPAALAALAPGEDTELELSSRTVRASAQAIPQGKLLVLYDVTRIRALEAVRREFLGNAAHELRTPVTSIAGYAETLLGAPVDADTQKEFLSTIQRNAQRIATLVSDLVLLDQLGGRDQAIGERVPVPLAPVVEDAAKTARGVAPAAAIEIAVSSDLVVLGTRDGLDHVVQNLIDNAVKYGGGTPVTVTATRTGDRIQLVIADRGPGIPKGQEDRVFERFYRISTNDRGGSGLGLAIVKSQVEAMGGRVWFEHGEPGARFVIDLAT